MSSDPRLAQLNALLPVPSQVERFIVPLALGDPAGSGPPLVNDLFNLATAALPVCLGVAVLKYRLYAIDRIISRVISYAIITAVLAGVFATF